MNVKYEKYFTKILFFANKDLKFININIGIYRNF